nr:hypothetical protein [uncultured Flavobacterium sp.]
MKTKLILFMSVILLLSCNDPKLEKIDTFYFNLYNNKNIIIENNIFTLEKKKLNLFDSVNIFKNNKKVLSFKQAYDKNGIYRYILNKKTLTHAFNDSTTLYTNYNNKFYIPFINKETTLINKKTYKIGKESYKVFHFSEEQNSHKGFDSYYLENVGFICYYNFDTDKYILCDSTSIKSLKIKEITRNLINDKTFFARFTVAKLFPNYYRQNNNSHGI